MNRIVIVVFLLTLSASIVRSQPIDQSVAFSKSALTKSEMDTARLLSDQPLKSPVGAVLRSAVLPGLGQVYNGKYVKGALVCAVNGAFAYAIYWYHQEWKDTGRTKYRDKRNLYTWYLGISYLLTLMDAYVDAYLFGFEKAIEISAIAPRSDQTVQDVAIAIRFSFEL